MVVVMHYLRHIRLHIATSNLYCLNISVLLSMKHTYGRDEIFSLLLELPIAVLMLRKLCERIKQKQIVITCQASHSHFASRIHYVCT